MKTRKFRVYDIKWDLDDLEDVNRVPNEMIVEVSAEDVDDLNDEEDVDYYISDYISDEVGFCHAGYECTEIFS